MLRPLDPPEQYHLAARVATLPQVQDGYPRALQCPRALHVYDLENPVGFAFAQSSDGELVVEIENYEGVVEVDQLWARELHAPFGRLRLADHLGLAPNQSVGQTYVEKRSLWQRPSNGERC